MMPVLALALCSLAAIAMAGGYLWAVLRRYPVRRRLANLLYPLSQLVAVGFTAWAALALDEGGGYSLLVSALGIAGALYAPAFVRGLALAEARDATAAYERAMAAQLAAQQAHLERLRAEAADVERARASYAAEMEAVAEALAVGDAPQAHRLLAELTARIPSGGTAYCRNPAVAALLAMKAGAAKRLHARFEVQAAIPADLALSEMEVCAVLANLVDNALAAVRELPEGERWVRVAARIAQGCLTMQVENPYRPVEGAAREEARRALPRHGWGLSIVRDIAARHEGLCAVEREEGIFRVRVVLPLG